MREGSAVGMFLSLYLGQFLFDFAKTEFEHSVDDVETPSFDSGIWILFIKPGDKGGKVIGPAAGLDSSVQLLSTIVSNDPLWNAANYFGKWLSTLLQCENEVMAVFEARLTFNELEHELLFLCKQARWQRPEAI